jgi:hypothetical protein
MGKKGWFFTGLLTTGLAAYYLFDEKKGRKRRKMLRQKAQDVWDEARCQVDHYSQELKPVVQKYAKEFSERAEHFADKAQRKQIH